MEGRIFISYRHIDSGLVCDRIYGTLKAAYGEYRVFRDLEAIPAGVDFYFTIGAALRNARVMLVLIGPQWLSITDGAGYRRLDNPADTVRQEIEYALQNELIVVPVLVQGAEMPHAEDVPPSLKALTYRNARQVRPDPDYLRDMRVIIGDLAEFLPPAGAASRSQAAFGAFRPIFGFMLSAITLILTVLSLSTWIYIPVLSDLVKRILGH